MLTLVFVRPLRFLVNKLNKHTNKQQSVKALWERVLGLGSLFTFFFQNSHLCWFSASVPTDMCCLHGVSVCPSVPVDSCRMLCPPHLHQGASSDRWHLSVHLFPHNENMATPDLSSAPQRFLKTTVGPLVKLIHPRAKYQLSIATIINYYKCSSIKQHTCITLQFYNSEV